MTNPRKNPDGYACPSCKQLLCSDHEADQLRTELQAEKEKVKVLKEVLDDIAQETAETWLHDKAVGALKETE